MAHNIGIWISHQEAIIVSLDEKEEKVETIESGTEKPSRQGGGARSKTPWGPQDISSDNQRNHHFQNALHRYYHQVITRLNEADAILIFGPGEAKGELKKHLEDTHILRDRIVGIETTDKMTVPQITAKVHEFYREYQRHRK